MADISDRLGQLEARNAILDTMYQYAHAKDYFLTDEFTDCFTEDCVYEVKPRLAPGRRVQGRTAMLAEFDPGRPQVKGLQQRHLNLEHRIYIEGNEGTVVSYLVELGEIDGVPRIENFGRYVDKVRKCADGKWRLSERHIELESAQPVTWKKLGERFGKIG